MRQNVRFGECFIILFKKTNCVILFDNFFLILNSFM